MCVCVYGVAKIAAQLCSLLVGTNSEMLLSNSIRSNGCACVRRELYHIGLTYWLRHAIVIHVWHIVSDRMLKCRRNVEKVSYGCSSSKRNLNSNILNFTCKAYLLTLKGQTSTQSFTCTMQAKRYRNVSMCWLIVIPVQLCLFQPHGLTPTTLSYTILLNMDAVNTYVQIYTELA